jgi:hypothetical protein
LDVACGGGRYDLEVLQEFEQKLGNNAIAATLRDYKLENVTKARQLATQFGVDAQIEQADAFNDEDLDRVLPRPNLVIVSGLHEILPNDALIKNHFQQLYRFLDSAAASSARNDCSYFASSYGASLGNAGALLGANSPMGRSCWI